MTIFIEHYYIIFMFVLLSLSILILLRTIVGTLAQIVLLGVLVLISQTGIMWLINASFIIQIAIALFLIYRLKRAIDYNFDLVLEKTHLVDRYYTKNEYSGSKKSFFF